MPSSNSKIESPREIIAQYRQVLEDCRKLYTHSAEECVRSYPELIRPNAPDEFAGLMGELFRGLILKIYFTMVEADGHWSGPEKELGAITLKRLWGRRLSHEQLRETMQNLSSHADRLNWFTLIRPFDQIAPLREYKGDLETAILRLANLVAKVDGQMCSRELLRLQSIQGELERNFRAVPLDEPGYHDLAQKTGNQAVRELRQEVARAPVKPAVADKIPEKSREQLLAEANAELDQLIGLDGIKSDVRSLVNFLKIQEERKRAGLPQTDVSLHMLYYGNPGTGKTTVARIIGKIFGAMGILSKGHLIETDRSGLVAGYAGQTAIKAGQKIDEALDGILFIDEAYSLVSDKSDDAYGAEAVQTLLKRMEDERQRLVVILAGYPAPMDRLLQTNPGLASRFNRRFDFPDYSPVDLAKIFQGMCEKNHYVIPNATRAKLLLGFRCLCENRDEHFGNGRLVRNLFENAIRHLANRVASIVPLTKTLLTTIEPDDIVMPTVSAQVWEQIGSPEQRYQVHCPGCQVTSNLRELYLGRRVRCKRCGARFQADWGEPC